MGSSRDTRSSVSDTTAPESARPVLLGPMLPVRPYSPPPGRGGARIRLTNDSQRLGRLDRQMSEVESLLNDQATLSESIQSADPQLVLVFEALDERTDLTAIALKLGFEILVEAEAAAEPDDEFTLRSSRPNDPQITSCIHAICVTPSGMQRILAMWNQWRVNRDLAHGLGRLADLFEHLKDVRAWGPVDRLKTVRWDEYFSGRLPGQAHTIEIELWYRSSNALRASAMRQVTELVVQDGGRVTASIDIPSIGYLAVKCEAPDQLVRSLADGAFEHARVVRSSHVLFLKTSGQARLSSGPDLEDETFPAPPARGRPRVCLVDGVPESNHERLSDRVIVLDPDDLSSDSTTQDRKHGTAMASAVVWGDLAANEAPLARPVLVRPVLVPSLDTSDRAESFRPADLIPDVMWRAFRDIFESGDNDGITVVNLSLGDPTLPFDSIVSSWARALDWLSFHYGVLIVVSAGNHPRLEMSRWDSDQLRSMGEDERREAILTAQMDAWATRRILSPAESINALTVGALHSDASGIEPRGYTFDPAGSLPSVSPLSGLGGGHRRSVKPDVAAPGGRVSFVAPVPATKVLTSSTAVANPGVRVAAAAAGRDVNITGTSPAAALVTRQLARLCDVVDDVAGERLSRAQRAVAAKALLVHGARHPAELPRNVVPLKSMIGWGAVVRDLAAGCEPHEATLLYLGEIGHHEQQDLLLPLPDGLNARDTKRVTATLAWLTPINWRHRQYRSASLGFAKPTGMTVLPAPIDLTDDEAKRGSGTVKHLAWEVQTAVATGVGDALTLTVRCTEQAGGLHGQRVPFAVALSLWVAPSLGVDVYTQVAAQVQPRVVVGSAS